MMKKILVTTDFSTNSKAGIRFAMQLAEQAKCKLVFYHVVEVLKPTSWSEKQFQRFTAEKVTEFTEKLREFALSLQAESRYKSKGAEFIVEIGTQVPEMIIRMAKKTKSQFICTTTRGAGKFQKIFGTYSSSLITTSPIPLIVLPQNYRVKPINDIFYASDFSSVAKELKQIEKFNEILGAKIEVFHYDYMLHINEIMDRLLKKAKRLESGNVTFNFVRREVDQTLSEQLGKDIGRRKPSMVALFTKQNRGWFDRFFLSSESADLSFNAKAPLLIFRKK